VCPPFHRGRTHGFAPTPFVVIANVSEAISVCSPCHATRLPRYLPPTLCFGGQVGRSQRRRMMCGPCLRLSSPNPTRPAQSVFPAKAGIQRQGNAVPLSSLRPRLQRAQDDG
jgi:hypothetical protein